ncbi:RNA polymerase sigma factor [Piscinibacter sakaiensis]|uniref:RNA polymerase sigma factor n=1 Tax=Piscinibacter sakaiensis TaxID=1547922 RepID=UPI003AACD673
MSAADPSFPDRAATAAEAGRAERDARHAELLAASAAGDASAFEVFFDATVGYARALGRRMLREPELDDALAGAYFDAWRHAAQFDAARGSAVSWLLTIVRNRALDRLRQPHPMLASITADGHDRIDDAADPADGPAERLWQLETQQRLHAALAGLSASERWVLGLAYFRDLSHREIAQATGLPLGSVKSLILRAQHKIRARLQPPATEHGESADHGHR